MSGYAIIERIGSELRRQIFDTLDSTPDVDFGLTDPTANVAIAPPSAELANTVLISLYLFDIAINAHLRNQPVLRTAPDELRRPPLPLQLRYLLTPHDDEDTSNHLMVGRILQHFHDHPVLGSVGGETLTTSFGGSSDQLRIRVEALTLEQSTQLWSALNQPYRLSVVLRVEAVAIDSALAPVRQTPVEAAYAVVGRRGESR
ncbi:MAG: DUF4255 domain-containing protein [Gammaproteobacteria bacterium]|nr:DUF4255 domain-containing protein [Gammaproteobacteria bacterium]